MLKTYFRLLALGALFFAGRNAQAQFSGDFAPTNWFLTNTSLYSTASVDATGAPSSILFIGNDSEWGDCCSLYDDYSIEIPSSCEGGGNITFNYDFVQPDIEEFYYVVNGASTFVTSDYETGTLSVPVSAGDIFGFRIYTDDDCCGAGELTISNFAYTPIDSDAPVANMASLPSLNGTCSVSAPAAPTATDNCAGAITGTTTTIFPVTSNLVITWSYNDGNGNISTQTQSVVLSDAVAPVPATSSLADVSGPCSVTPSAPSASDNCAGILTGTTSTIFPITTIGTTVVTWAYNDGNGNITTQAQNIIVTDATAPVANVSSLPDVTGNCSVAMPTAPTALDDCAGTITATTSTTFPITAIGATVVTWTYDDGNGNTTTQDQNIVVVNSLVLSATTTDETVGGNDGAIDLTITGSTGSETIDWDNDGTGDNDDTEDLNGLAAGTYVVTVMDGGCADILSVVVNGPSTSGLTETSADFSVYPNPTSGLVAVSLNTNTADKICVVNALGQTVFSVTVTNSTVQLDLSAFENGIYLVQFIQSDVILHTEKITKK